jgi:CheY-like chemotaxis protein
MEQETGGDKRKAEPVISRAIQALLDRHGVPERRRNTTLEAAAGMKYQQVRRRMTGETSWNVDEIKRLASHFGEPVFKLLGALVDDAGQPAVLKVAGLQLACSVWPGEAIVGDKAVGPLVAVQDGESGEWEVVPPADAAGRTVHEVRRVIFEAEEPRRVAVIDDDEATAEAIVQVLRQKGLEAISYSNAEHIRSALETTTFDGYIVDWQLGEQDARDLLQLIRSRTAAAPLIVLADTLTDSQEAQFEEITATFRAQLFVKPARTLMLFNALTLGFAALRRTPG